MPNGDRIYFLWAHQVCSPIFSRSDEFILGDIPLAHLGVSDHSHGDSCVSSVLQKAETVFGGQCHMNWTALLMIGDSVLWSATYCFLIYKAIKDKRMAMPIWALAMNFTWECFYFFVFKDAPSKIIAGIWAVLDSVLLTLLLKYNKRYFPSNLRNLFYPLVVIALATCLAMQFALYFGTESGMLYSGYMDCLIMSILFSFSLFERVPLGYKETIRGHDLYAASCKMLGTACVTIQFGILGDTVNMFILITGILCFLFDVLYIVVLSIFTYKAKEKSL